MGLFVQPCVRSFYTVNFFDSIKISGVALGQVMTTKNHDAGYFSIAAPLIVENVPIF